MPVGLLLGLVASLGWGALDIAVALSTRTVGTLRVLVGSQLVSFGTLVVIALLFPVALGPSPLEGMLAGVPLGVLAAAAYLAYFTALHLGPLSIVSPVVVAYGGLTVALAVVIRGEILSGQQASGVLLVTAGVALAGLVLDAGSGGRRPRLASLGVAAAVAALIGFAILTVALADPIRSHGWLPVLLGSRLGNSLAALVLLVVALGTRARRLEPMLEPSRAWTRRIGAYVVMGGAFDVLAFVAYAVGLQIAPVWLIGLSSSLGPVLPVMYAIGWLGERPRRTQWMGLGLIVLGMLTLALSG
jgi:drug/metabolite transporter (DMT)-like permease